MSSFIGLRVSRMSGAQNTFFIANIFEPSWSQAYSAMSDSDKASLAAHLCTDFHGFHTDGLLYLRPENQFDFAWDFYNSDGSHAEMCGNAARCAAFFFYHKVKAQKQMKFLTVAGEITGEVLSPELVRVEMTKISDPKEMSVLGHTGFYINTGVPHFVLEERPDANTSKQLRKVSDFGTAGANITFVENLKQNYLQAVTFERGVEDFTQACGTGAVAAAMYLQSKKMAKNSVDVQMPGGILTIEGAGVGKRPFLTGSARIEFDIDNWELK